MIKNLLLSLLAVAIFIIALGLYLQKSGGMGFSNQGQQKSEPTVEIKGKKIVVEIAKTPEERKKGLSDRSSLDQDSGMLFVFDSLNEPQSFWMKDMLIPIDIIWINNGEIVRIDKSVPPPTEGTPDDKLIRYSAQQAVDYVLEVNSGYSEANSFEVGGVVTFSGI